MVEFFGRGLDGDLVVGVGHEGLVLEFGLVLFKVFLVDDGDKFLVL